MRHMGRIFEVRKHTMFARWNRMAKQFARIAKDITMAVKSGGPDPSSNPTLRRTIQNARAVNMPKDRIEAAIKRASGRDAANYHQVLYEGYAPHGVALLVETATDNPTRTVAAVRNVITKNGGNLATSGSVSFLFKKMGVFRLDPSGIDQDDLELYLIDHGLEEMGEGTGEKGEPLQQALHIGVRAFEALDPQPLGDLGEFVSEFGPHLADVTELVLVIAQQPGVHQRAPPPL